MIAISTYSGECDGLGYAAELAGIEVAAYCEAHPKRRQKLAEKHPGKPIFIGDEELTADAMRDLGIYPDLLFGGPPCQPFSNAGARRGTDDSRHRWPQMLRFIRECRPRWVVVENVGGFVSLALDVVCADLEAEGYEVGPPLVFPALAVGAPHRRDRCFVVGYTQCERQQRDDRGRSGTEPENGCASGGMAHATGSRPKSTPYTGICCGKKSSGARHVGPELCGGGGHASLADAVRAREPQPSGVLAERGRRAVNGGEGMVHPEGIRGRAGCVSERDGAQHAVPVGRDKNDFARAVESRLGRVLDGVSDRLDAVMASWPAWRGQHQHPWEPPRTVMGMKDRPRRIESLGLAVVPWQAYPIFVLIKELDDMRREDEP